MIKINDTIKRTIIKRDVQGELDCFYECYQRLSGKDQALNNKNGWIREPYRRICLDCFLLHARNLFDFFCIIPKKDDVSVNHFYSCTIKLIRNVPIDRINKQLSHITYDRLSPRQKDLFNERNKIYNAIIDATKKYNQRVRQDFQVKLSHF